MPALPPLSDFLSLAELLLRFARVERTTYHPDQERLETDADHTVMLAVFATSLAAHFRLEPGLVAQFAVLHDLVEVYDGDVQTFGLSEEGRQAKEEQERIALARLGRETAAFPWIAEMLERYEAQKEPEARFVRYLDKLLPRLTQILSDGAVFHREGRRRADVTAWQERQLVELAERYPEFPEVGALLTQAVRETNRLAPE